MMRVNSLSRSDTAVSRYKPDKAALLPDCGQLEERGEPVLVEVREIICNVH